MGLKLAKGLKNRNKNLYENLPNLNYPNFNQTKRFYNQQEYYNPNINYNPLPRNYNKEKELRQYKRDILNYSLPLHYEQICEILQGTKQVPGYMNPNIQNIVSQPILLRYPPNAYKNPPQPILHQYIPQNIRPVTTNPIINRIPCKKCLACPNKCYVSAFNANKPKLIFEEIYPLKTSQKKFFENNKEFSDEKILEKIRKVNFELSATKS
jgi:hypothetical protein